jgi:glycosyltransferase involved in cell wall biosynthesis
MERSVNHPLISILICRLVGREEMFNNLMRMLRPQLGNIAEVVDFPDAGAMPIGEKRNRLLAMATGKYSCFVDDDDMISNNYVSLVVNALRNDPDCAELRGRILYNNEWRDFRHSIKYCGWYENEGIFYRTPNHLNAIRTDIAREAGFCATMSIGEDWDYSQRVLPMLKTEGAIEKAIYIYTPTAAREVKK